MTPGMHRFRSLRDLLLIGVLVGWRLLPSLCAQPAPPHVPGVPAFHPTAPAVWIFVGLPGDPGREQRYLATVTAIQHALTTVLTVPAGQITILFGSGKPSPYRACNRTNLFHELGRACTLSAARKPIWLIFIGHANSTKHAVYFNLPGKDVSGTEIAAHLARMDPDCPTVILLTTAAAGRFIAPLHRRNRILAAAVAADREDNETEMPYILADVLQDAGAADSNGDGVLSVTELLREVNRRTDAWYAEHKLVPTEGIVLDGNGDGKAHSLPNSEEELPAAGLGIALRRRPRESVTAPGALFR